jgi:hypothetical protein
MGQRGGMVRLREDLAGCFCGVINLSSQLSYCATHLFVEFSAAVV